MICIACKLRTLFICFINCGVVKFKTKFPIPNIIQFCLTNFHFCNLIWPYTNLNNLFWQVYVVLKLNKYITKTHINELWEEEKFKFKYLNIQIFKRIFLVNRNKTFVHLVPWPQTNKQKHITRRRRGVEIHLLLKRTCVLWNRGFTLI